jgi:hypothetical protein
MTPTDQIPTSSLVSFERWLEEIGKTPATGWRWRKRGWIKTVNIAGRLYISREEIAEFERRASAGEFSKIHETPNRHAETPPPAISLRHEMDLKHLVKKILREFSEEKRRRG